jgi:hypothetical protein
LSNCSVGPPSVCRWCSTETPERSFTSTVLTRVVHTKISTITFYGTCVGRGFSVAEPDEEKYTE